MNHPKIPDVILPPVGWSDKLIERIFGFNEWLEENKREFMRKHPKTY